MPIINIVPLILFAVFVPQTFALAAGWWGNGYKPPEWILSNGGSIIRLNIKDDKPEEFKAFMTRNGKYVEVEFGDNMVFDDAKDGTYNIRVYDCNRDCSSQKYNDKTKLRGNDKKRASLNVVARPGQTTLLTYDADDNELYVTGTDGRAPTPPTPPKPTLTPEQIITQKAVAAKGQVCDVKKLHPSLEEYFISPS